MLYFYAYTRLLVSCLSLEIMEQMALQQEAAFERLYRWNQSQCRSMTSSTLDVTPMQQEAMKALQGRLVLFT